MNQGSRHHRARKLREAMRLALAEFLLVPTGIIVGFLLLAACTFVLDRSSAAWLMPIRTLPPELQLRVEDVIRRTLSALGDHVLTNELESALTGLISTLEQAGRRQTAAAVLAAKDQLARSIGKLGARLTRAG